MNETKIIGDLKYLETAKLYEEIREIMISKFLFSEKNTVLSQTDTKEKLINTEEDFSFGYNEDSYIKSSIAFEIELYMRYILSKEGLTEENIKKIFCKHNLKDVFSHFTKDIKSKVYIAYLKEITKKTIKECNYNQILESEEVETALNNPKNIDDNMKKTLMKIYVGFKKIGYYKGFESLNAEENYKKLCLMFQNEEINQTSFAFNNDLYQSFTEKIFKNKKFINYLETIDLYIKSEYLIEKYNELSNSLKVTNEKITILNNQLNKLKGLYISLRKQKKVQNSEKLEDIMKEISEIATAINNLRRKKDNVESEVQKIEDQIDSVIFPEKLAIETAYQDNRYSYDKEKNNNFIKFSVLLNVLKQVGTGTRETTLDYDDMLRIIQSQQKERDGQTIITNNHHNYPKNKGRFTKNNSDSKFDALYSAEIRYLGAIHAKNRNENLYMAELGIACELYFKSILPTNERTHSLKDLFVKLNNNDKCRVVRKVNSNLNTNYTVTEFITILEKKSISGAFSEYRYTYENTIIEEEKKEFLEALTNALHITIAKPYSEEIPYYNEIDKMLLQEKKFEERMSKM